MNYPTKKVYECIERIPRKSGIPLKKYQKYGDFPIIDQGMKFIGGYTNNLTLVYTDNLPVVVFGDHTRVLKFVDFQFAVGADGTKVLQPKDFLDAKYFYFSLMSLSIETRGYARHFRILKDQEIPLPPIAEQKKIVARVEKLLAKVKDAKRLRAEVRAAAESLLSAELHKIFEEGKKKGWDVCNIGDKKVMDMTSGGTPSRSNKSYYQGNIAWLKSGELGDNINILDSEEHITEDAIKRSSAKVFPKHTVLLAMYGATAGKLGILGNQSATNQAVAGMICNENCLHYKYLFYVLVDIRNRIVMQAWGGAQPNLSQTIIKKFQIPLPSLTEQKKIVARLDALSAKLKKIEEYRKSAESDLDRLEQSILHQAFSGALMK